MKDPEDARDIAQVAWVRAWECREQFREGCSFYTWVINIALHACVDGHRCKVQAPMVQMADGFDVGTPATADVDVLVDEVHRWLMSAIDQVQTKGGREVLLARLEGLEYQEIAKLQGIPLETAKVHGKRATDELKRMAAKA